MIFLVLLLLPLLIAGGAFLFGGNRVTWKEFLLQAVIQAVVAGISIAIIYSSNTGDVEIWNGTVMSKKRQVVSCEHSYQCNCYQSCSSDSKGNQSCTTICQTCYEHSYDVDWDVYTTNGEGIGISRVDRQGLREPQRWTNVLLGEPTSKTHGFKNYIKAAPDTLFRHEGLVKQYEKVLPAYPGGVFDYYRLNRTIPVGGMVPDLKNWNEKLSVLNGNLGKKKQVNAIIVLVWDQPRDFYYALEQKWIGGKKNDVVLVVGVDSGLVPQWTEVMAWAKDPVFQVKLRDAVMDLKKVELSPVMAALGQNIDQFYQRKPMKDFEYLASSITPTPTQWVVSLLLGFLIALGVSYWCYTQDIFGDEWRRD